MLKFVRPIFFIVLLAQASAWAFPFGSEADQFVVPALTSPVMDQAQVISGRQEEMLNQLIRDYNQQGKAQISVLTVTSLHGLTIEEASIKVTDQWKLGTEKKDNGILILVAVQERKARIEVGQGFEGALPDVFAKRILAEVSRPYFKQGLYGEGIYAAVMQVLKIIDKEFVGTDATAGSVTDASDQKIKLKFLIALFFLVFGLISFLSRFMSGGRGGHGGWGGPGFGGGSGGGGWSGGGGGFSGGGASDSW